MIDDNEETDEVKDRFIGLVVISAAAISFAICSTWNRKLKQVHFSVLMVYHALIGATLALLYILVEGYIRGEFRIYTLRQYGILLVAVLLDTVACFAMTIAFQKDKGGFVSLFSYSKIVYGFLADIFLLPEQILPLEIIGASLIFLVTISVSVIKLCELKK